MATVWTLEYAGTEQTLEAWGFLEDFTATFVNKGSSYVTFRTNERFDPGAPQIQSFPAWFRANPSGSPASRLAKIWRDRTSVGSGGTVYFAGYFDDPVRLSEGGLEHIQYVLRDVLWLFERNQFKQTRKQFNGWSTPGDPSSGATYVTKVCTELFLGEATDATVMKETEQLTEIINWMNESYNPTRRGAVIGIDATKDVVQAGTLNPAARAPKTRVNTVSCLEAMNNVLRWAPDAVFKVDHTTTVPTLHVLTMAKWNYATDPPTFVDYTNLAEVTIDITAQQEKRIQMQTVSARQLPGVIIYYMSSSTVDSVTVPVIVRDPYPVLTDDFYPEVSCHAVEMAGRKVTHLKANVVVNENTNGVADAVTGSAGARKIWWAGDTGTSKKAHTDFLKDPKIDASTITIAAATVKDAAGNNVNLATYPNELCSDLPQWVLDQFGVVKIRATVMAEAEYTKYTESGHINKDHSKTKHVLTKSLWLTNAVTQEYSAVQTFDPGESIPNGLAESIYRAVAIAQNAGDVEFRDDQLRSDIYIGCRLKLTGPNTTFTNILPQTITTRPCRGTTQVTFGPSAIIDAEGLIELARATRFRLIYNMPSGRADGMGQGSTSVDQTARSPIEDATAGVGGSKFSADTFTPP